DTPRLASLPDRDGPRRQRPQGAGFSAVEAGPRLLVGRAVLELVGVSHPPREVGLERSPRRELAGRERIVLHVADAALGLALGARAVWLARAHIDAPVVAERLEPRVDAHVVADVLDDQRLGIVDKHGLRDAAEVVERAGETLAPVVVLLP